MPSTVNRHNEWAHSTITAGACDILKKPTPLPNLIINYYTLNSAIRAYGLSLQCTLSNDRNILSSGRRGPGLPQRQGALGPLTIGADKIATVNICWDMVLHDGWGNAHARSKK